MKLKGKTLNVNCSEMLVNCSGMIFRLKELGDFGKVSQLTFENGKDSPVQFLNLKYLVEILVCPICGKKAEKINEFTLAFKCPCAKKEGMLQVKTI